MTSGEEELVEWKVGVLVNGTYEIKKELGGGGFGNVLLAIEHVSQSFVALKYDKKKEGVAVLNEIKFYTKLKNRSQFICGYVTCGIFERCPFIVLEKMDWSLHDVMLDREQFTLPTSIKVCQQIFWGLNVLHDLGIVHSDIKPKNILCSRIENNIKICDFGCSILLKQRKNKNNHQKEVPICGAIKGLTLQYATKRMLEEKRVSYSDDAVMAFYTTTRIITKKALFASPDGKHLRAHKLLQRLQKSNLECFQSIEPIFQYCLDLGFGQTIDFVKIDDGFKRAGVARYFDWLNI